MGHCKSSAKGKVHSYKGLSHETRDNLTLHLKQLERKKWGTLRLEGNKS